VTRIHVVCMPMRLASPALVDCVQHATMQANAVGNLTTCVNIIQRLPVCAAQQTCSDSPIILVHILISRLQAKVEDAVSPGGHESGMHMQVLQDADAYGDSQQLLAVQQDLVGKQMQSFGVQMARLRDLMCAPVAQSTTYPCPVMWCRRVTSRSNPVVLGISLIACMTSSCR
jgi:hypothetical protein